MTNNVEDLLRVLTAAETHGPDSATIIGELNARARRRSLSMALSAMLAVLVLAGGAVLVVRGFDPGHPVASGPQLPTNAEFVDRTWTLDSATVAGTMQQPLRGFVPTLSFTSNGQFAATVTCAGLTGTWSRGNNNTRITFDDVVSSMSLCETSGGESADHLQQRLFVQDVAVDSIVHYPLQLSANHSLLTVSYDGQDGAVILAYH